MLFAPFDLVNSHQYRPKQATQQFRQSLLTMLCVTHYIRIYQPKYQLPLQVLFCSDYIITFNKLYYHN